MTDLFLLFATTTIAVASSMFYFVERRAARYWRAQFHALADSQVELAAEAYRRGMQLRTDADGIFRRAQQRAQSRWN